MRTVITIATLLFSLSLAYAQIKTSVQLSDKTNKAINQVKGGIDKGKKLSKDARKLKKLNKKERRKQMKELKAQLKHRSDSMRSLLKQRDKWFEQKQATKVGEQIPEEITLGTDQIDQINGEIDKLNQELAKYSGEYGEYLQKFEKIKSYKDLDKLSKDLESQSLQFNEVQELQDRTKNIEEFNKLVEEMKAPKELGDLKSLQGVEGLEGLKELDGLKEMSELNDLKDIQDLSQLKDIEGMPEDLKIPGEIPQDVQLGEGKDLQEKLDNTVSGQTDKLKNQASKYQNKEFLKKQLQAKAKNLANKHFTQHKDKLKVAHEKMAKLKKKYSVVPSSKDLSTAKKINSLEDEPFKDRLAIGGNLQIQQGEPIKIDFSPTIGYKFNKQFVMGFGGTYRTTFGKRNPQIVNQVADEVMGYRTYVDYKAYKSYSIHAEYEDLLTDIMDQTGDVIGQKWKKGALLGIGKSYNFVKGVRGQMLLMYNFLHDDESPHQRPLVVRFGFELK